MMDGIGDYAFDCMYTLALSCGSGYKEILICSEFATYEAVCASRYKSAKQRNEYLHVCQKCPITYTLITSF